MELVGGRFASGVNCRLDASDSPVRVLTKLRESANCEVVATFRVIGIGRFMNLDHVVVPGPGCADHGGSCICRCRSFRLSLKVAYLKIYLCRWIFFVVMMEGDVVGGFNRGDHGGETEMPSGVRGGARAGSLLRGESSCFRVKLYPIVLTARLGCCRAA